MHVDPAILSTPVAQGIRLVALGYLGDAHEAGERLTLEHDPDALHDFRVAVRRTRSWLRAFDDELSGSVKKKDQRRLRDIARATNPARDIDVQVAWLDAASKGFRAKRRRGADWLSDQLKARRRGAEADTAAIVDDFERARGALVHRLSTYAQRVELPHHGQTLAAAIAERVMPHAHAVDEKLALVRSVDDETEAHQARIAAKRLRYLIEPAARLVERGSEIVTGLKSLQDALGSLHDAHVMGHVVDEALATAADEAGADEHASSDIGDGLRALATRARADARDAFTRVREDWLGERFARFSDELATFADRLAALHE